MTRHLGPGFYYTLALAIVATAVAVCFAITSSHAQIAVLSLGPVTFPVIYGFEAWRKWWKDQGNSRK